jgi:uncharacterized protein YndB with AHSA1/START domain
MEKPNVIHNTFVIERSYPATPERAFAAFSDPARKRRWFVESDNNQIEHYELDFRVGGKELARFRFTKPGTLVTGLVCVNEGNILELAPGRSLVTASTMTIAGRCISASLATFEFLPSATGTDLIFTHQGAFFEGSDGPAMRQDGWRKLLDKLTAELAS